MSILRDLAWGTADWFIKSPLMGLALSHFKSQIFKPRKLGYEPRPDFRTFAVPLRNLPRLKQVSLPAKIEQHDAVRAGSHLDFRIQMPDGNIQDFAITRRIQFPKETGTVYNVVRTPHHSQKYFQTDRATFGPGEYGEGEMRTIWRGQIDVHEANPNKLEFTIPEGDFSGRFVIRDTGKGWILSRMKESLGLQMWRPRMDYTNTDKARAEAYASDDYLGEIKYNGAHYLLVPGPKENVLLSRRLSVDGSVIDRSNNIPQLRDLKIPKEFHNRRIHVETISGPDDCRTSPSTTAGLLNANPGLSRDNQVRLGQPLRVVIFEGEGPGNYLERKADLSRLARFSPRVDLRKMGSISARFTIIRRFSPRLIKIAQDNLQTNETVKSFADRVKAEGWEGAVLKRKDGQYYGEPFIKDKKVETVDLQISGFQEGTGKYLGSLGALICQDPQTGAITKVGTGFSDYERQWIWDHQTLINDQLIEVEANWQIQSTGTWHGPRYAGFHPESGIKIQDEQDLLDYAEAISGPGLSQETKYRLISSRGWKR